MENPRSRDRSPRFASSREDVSFGESVAAFTVGSDRFEHPLVRATAFVSSAADLFEAELFGPAVEAARLESWLRHSAEVFALDATGDRFLDLLGEDDHWKLADAVGAIVRQYGTGSDWVQLLYRSVRVGDRFEDVADRAGATTTGPTELSPDPIARAAAPQPDERDDQPEISITEPGHLRVDFPGRPSGGWVRVLDRASLALIALVPVAEEGRRRFAEALVPSNMTVDAIEIETTDNPLPSSSTSSVETMVEAIDAGRRATMLSARRDPSADEHWKVCSGLWRQLGDEMRANIAEAYASREERVERSWQVHDSVREVIEG